MTEASWTADRVRETARTLGVPLEGVDPARVAQGLEELLRRLRRAEEMGLAEEEPDCARPLPPPEPRGDASP